MNATEHAKRVLEEERKREHGRAPIEETLCEKPHNNGDDRPEVCTECMMIKLGL